MRKHYFTTCILKKFLFFNPDDVMAIDEHSSNLKNEDTLSDTIQSLSTVFHQN